MYIEPSMSHDGFPFCSALCHQPPQAFLPSSFVFLSFCLPPLVRVLTHILQVHESGRQTMARSNFTEVEQPIFRDPSRSSLSFLIVFSICLRPSTCLSSLLQLFSPLHSLSGYFLWKYIGCVTKHCGRVQRSFCGLERVSFG